MPAQVDAGYEDAQRQVFLPSRNLSESGIFLVFHDPPSPGSPVQVLLELPGHPEILRLRGVVARAQQAEPKGFAVEFDQASISRAARAALRGFVERNVGVGV